MKVWIVSYQDSNQRDYYVPNEEKLVAVFSNKEEMQKYVDSKDVPRKHSLFLGKFSNEYSWEEYEVVDRADQVKFEEDSQ